MNTTSFLSCFILNSSFTTLHSVILSVWTILQQVIPVLLLNWIIFLFNHLLTPWVCYVLKLYNKTIYKHYQIVSVTYKAFNCLTEWKVPTSCRWYCLRNRKSWFSTVLLMGEWHPHSVLENKEGMSLAKRITQLLNLY